MEEEKTILIFVDFTNEQNVEQFKIIAGLEFVQEYIDNKTKYLIFNMNTGFINMIVDADNNVLTTEENSIEFGGVNDITDDQTQE
jgi:hypothetical protein